MSLKALVRVMAPVIPKRQLVESITKTRQQLKDHLIPSFTRSAEVTSGKPLNSKFSKVVNARYNDFASLSSPNKNFIEKTLVILIQVEKNEEFVLAGVNATFKDNIATEAMRFKELTLINYQCALANVVEYSTRLLNLFWIAEMNTIKGKPQFDGVSRGEHDYVESGLTRFLQELSAVNHNRDALEKTLEQITDSIFDPEDEETTRSLMDNSKLDPLGFGFIPPAINPIFIAGRIWVERQDKAYRATQLDLQRVEIRIKAYQEIQNNSPNPTTEKTLIALDDLRTDLQLKLNKLG